VNDHPFQVRASLFQALLELTAQGLAASLLVDQISINQDHDCEKQQQVRLMSRIYQRANRVIRWLGVRENNSNLAFKLLRIYGLSHTGNLTAWQRDLDDLIFMGHVKNYEDLFNLSGIPGTSAKKNDEDYFSNSASPITMASRSLGQHGGQLVAARWPQHSAKA
jgi:hypothetical protein